jgi:hypothetical protein
MTDNLPAVKGVMLPGGYDPDCRPFAAFGNQIPICGAMRSNGKDVCHGLAVKKPSDTSPNGWEYGRCRKHGGTRWKTEMRKKGVPLADRLQVALSDWDLQNMEEQVLAAAAVVREYMDMLDAESGGIELSQMEKLLQMNDTLSKITKRMYEVRDGKKLTVKVEHIGEFKNNIIVLVNKHFGQYDDAIEGFIEDVAELELPG